MPGFSLLVNIMWEYDSLFMSYNGPLEDVSSWRGIFEPRTATSSIECERVRIGYKLAGLYPMDIKYSKSSLQSAASRLLHRYCCDEFQHF